MGRVDSGSADQGKEPKRLAILKDHADFQPQYKFEFDLPEVPVKPKLFKYKFDSNKSHGYELSSIEINQGHLINVDFNMGIDLDLVDRSQYFLSGISSSEQHSKADEFHYDQQGISLSEKELEELRLLHFDEKDRFILSNKNTLDAAEKRVKERITSADIILPSRYERVDKVIKQGVDFKDPLAVRQLTEQEGEQIIMTHPDYYQKKEQAVQQIERRFEQTKSVKVGMAKEGHPDVVAEEVFDLIPFQQLTQNQSQIILCDDALEDEFYTYEEGQKPLENNGILLHANKEKALEHSCYGLYKLASKLPMSRPLAEQLLGKRKVHADELEKAVCLEYVRDYVLFNTTSEEGNEALLQLDRANRQAKLIPIKERANIQKKKKQTSRRAANFEDQEENPDGANSSKPSFIVVAARGFMADEIKRLNALADCQDLSFKFGLDSQIFADKPMLKDEEKRCAPQLKGLFDHVQKKKPKEEQEDRQDGEGQQEAKGAGGRKKLRKVEEEEEEDEKDSVDDLFGEDDDE